MKLSKGAAAGCGSGCWGEVAQCWQIQRHHSTFTLNVLRRASRQPEFLQIEARTFDL
jgi:hypothetical protein